MEEKKNLNDLLKNVRTSIVQELKDMLGKERSSSSMIKIQDALKLHPPSPL